MAGFFSQALQLIGDLYRPNGGARFPDQIDLASPISVVHDVSREIELGTVVTDPLTAGFFQVGQDNVHVGATTMVATVPVYTNLASTWGIPGERWVWLMYAWASGLTADMTSAQLSMSIPDIGASLALRDVMLTEFSAPVEFHDVTTNAFEFALQPNTRNPGFMQRPVPIFPEASLGWRTVSSAATTMRLTTVCWVGPQGVYPPGL